jgi:TonB family protein
MNPPNVARKPDENPKTQRNPNFTLPSLSLFREWMENLSAAIAPCRALQSDMDLRWLPAEASAFNGTERLRAQELSLVTHLLLATLMFVPLFGSISPSPGVGKPRGTHGPLILPDWSGWKRTLLADSPGNPHPGKGGGGDRNPLPPTKGSLPIFSWLQQAPPGNIRNLAPRLPVEPSLVGPPEISIVPHGPLGVPWEKEFNDSQGPGGPTGYGRNGKDGVGDRDGPSAGNNDYGFGTPGPPGRGGVGYPECLMCPLPKFTEEARKSKYQGTVTLLVVITADGRATNIRVSRGLGMGLDEEAVAAVRGWKFKPARAPDGRPVAVTTPIEVTFRLL